MKKTTLTLFWCRRCLLACFLFLPLLTSYAQNCLDFTWHIKTGDSAQWHAAGFVPRNWGQVNIGVNLEKQGYACCSGYYSLWNQVTIPAKFKTMPGGVQLRFRFVAEKADVYLNGKLIGNSQKPGDSASFPLPASLVKWGKPNQVSIRLLNPSYTGGTCANYIHIGPANAETGIFFDPEFMNEEHVYADSTNIRFSAFAHLFQGEPIRGNQKAIVINQFGDTVYKTQYNLEANTEKKSLLYTINKLSPGFYQVQFSFSAPGVEAQEIAAFAVAPQHIKTSPINEPEVKAYWNNALKELATIDPQYKLTKVDSLCSQKNNVYLLEMRSLGDLTVRGWYITPAKAGTYPAIAHFQGYSVAWKPRWFLNDTDVVHLALDIRGHGLSADVINPGFGCPGYVGYNIDKPEQYIYRGAYMDAYRAVDFLFTRREVDTNRVAVSGHSQGGALSVAMAAFHADRIKCCITASPWLCDFAGHVKIRPVYWNEMEYYMKEKNISREQVYKTMNLVDIINLCQYIRCPVVLGTGLFDDDVPSYVDFAMFNLINTKKTYRILPKDGHLLGKEWATFSRNLTRRMLGLQEGQ